MGAEGAAELNENINNYKCIYCHTCLSSKKYLIIEFCKSGL